MEFFLSVVDFFPVCHSAYPVIHSWAFVYQSSIFRVVDVVYVLLVIQLLRMNGFFPLFYGFFLCVMVYTKQ